VCNNFLSITHQVFFQCISHSLQVDRRAEEVSRLLDLLETINDGNTPIDNCLPSSFDVSSLKGRIEVDEPLIMGHSFGGATTLNVLHKDDRFK